jgi:3',5'-cyclic AMP phosphodiesterase CpdA
VPAAAPELIVQISDPHLRVGPDDRGSGASLAAAVAAVGRLDPAPAAVLLTGDIAERGAPAEYERVREFLHPLPGNLDDRDALRAAFADHPGVAATTGCVQYTVRCGSIRVVMCDTQLPGSHAGALGPERLAWLGAALALERAAPTVIAMHHPPVLCGIREIDGIALPPDDRRALAAAVDAAPHVRRLVAGHVHRAFTGRLGACPVVVCPSVHLQAVLDLSAGDLRHVSGAPAMAVHVLLADGELASHVHPIEVGPDQAASRPSAR